jgi:hypothetical protein
MRVNITEQVLNAFIFNENGRLTQDDIVYAITNSDGNKRIFNCIFINELRFNLSFNKKIVFENCIFEKTLFFKGEVDEIEFLNCGFEDELTLEAKLKSLVLKGDTHESNNIDILSSIRKIQIDNVKLNRLKLYFSTEIFSSSLKKITVIEDVYLKGEVSRTISFDQLICRNIISSVFVPKESAIEFAKLTCYNAFSFEKGLAIDCLKISHSKIKKFSNNNVVFGKLKLFDFSVDELKIIATGIRESLSARFCNAIESLRLEGIQNENVTFEILDSSIGKLSFEEYENNGELKISNIKFMEDAEFMIEPSCRIGKYKFYEIDFTKVKFHIAETDFLNGEIINCDFPETILKTSGKKSYSHSKFFFGQLCVLFQRQGDSVRSYEYQAREVDSYYHLLIEQKGKFLEKLTLTFNKYSNDFGRDWGRSILFSVAVGLLFFSLLVPSTQQYNIGFSGEETIRLIPPFLKFMNPLRHFETMELFKNIEGGNAIVLSNWSYLWDFLGRIFVAYGYYQTIQAFRKYGRK